MVADWTFTTSGAAIAKAGAGANADIIASVATLGKWNDQAEAAIAISRPGSGKVTQTPPITTFPEKIQRGNS